MQNRETATQKFVGARLIAPTITKEGKIDSGSNLKKGFKAAIEGGYPLENPILDIAEQVVYSVDMVRLEFYHENQQKVIDTLDIQMVLCTSDSFTSNRIGTYRFMWTFDLANGEDGGYCIEKDGELITDGGEQGVKIKVGYGVVGKSGNSNKGFIEFNPNKCERNAKKLIRLLQYIGCLFNLKRYDLAIDYSIPRNKVRLFRDRRKYEFICSNKGGITEYLGARNAPGRVKVYDKAGEQELDCDLTRVELTCDANWTIKEIKEHLPICSDYSAVKVRGVMLALVTIISDLLAGTDEELKPAFKDFDLIPERYWQILPKNTRYRLKKVLRNSKRLIDYNEEAIKLCVERAKSFSF